MKKLIYIFATVMLLGGVLASCSSHERCPAYGDIQPPVQEDKA